MGVSGAIAGPWIRGRSGTKSKTSRGVTWRKGEVDVGCLGWESMTMEFHYATIWESLADAVGDAEAVVQGDRRYSWAEHDERAARLAGFLADAGVGLGSKVSMYLYNSPEYLETHYAALKLRAVPVNVNYRYLDTELAYLLENSDSEAVVYHSSLGERVAAVRDRLPLVKAWIEVDDGGAPIDGSHTYESALAQATPAARITRSGDDVSMFYTGGTTGMPKGVMGSVGSGVRGGIAGLAPLVGVAPGAPETLAATASTLAAQGRLPRSLIACPLMHGTGMGIGCTPSKLFGACAVLTSGRKFDPAEVWDTIERESATMVTIVGDAFSRPMVRVLDEDRAAGRSRDLGKLRVIASSGAMFSKEMKEALVDHIPQVTILDIIAATEATMGQSVYTKDNPTQTASFKIGPNTQVFDEDNQKVAPGSGVMGMVAVADTVPMGYYKDPEKSARTVRSIDGLWWTFPGDFAMVEADGTITLLGRGSQVINTAGEKVFAEEVEETLKTHPSVDDCLVVGLPDERFGQSVTAVVSLVPGISMDHATLAGDLVSHAKARLASYKAPRRVVVVDAVPRAANGKADYATAKSIAQATAQSTDAE
jgi:3-oxocholest-4-en-26-oate---CoA ligase